MNSYFNQHTLVPVGLIVSIVVSSVSLALYIQARFNDLDMRMKEVQVSSQMVWRVYDQERFANRLKQRNPALDVPDTDSIRRN